MKLRVHILDLVKFDKLLSQNEFLRSVLEPISGEWFINTDKISNVKFFLDKARIRYKIE